MKLIDTPLQDVKIIVPAVFNDSRGSFYESYSQRHFEAAGIKETFVQDNQSESSRGVLRGLHFQRAPYEQGKLVRVVRGAVIDVVFDMRKHSPTYGRHFSYELNNDNKHLLWIPPGFAHGFVTLEDHTIFIYKCTNFYNKASEGGIRWDDPDLNINWGVAQPLVSEKDAVLPYWKEINDLH